MTLIADGISHRLPSFQNLASVQSKYFDSHGSRILLYGASGQIYLAKGFDLVLWSSNFDQILEKKGPTGKYDRCAYYEGLSRCWTFKIYNIVPT